MHKLMPFHLLQELQNNNDKYNQESMLKLHIIHLQHGEQTYPPREALESVLKTGNMVVSDPLLQV